MEKNVIKAALMATLVCIAPTLWAEQATNGVEHTLGSSVAGLATPQQTIEDGAVGTRTLASQEEQATDITSRAVSFLTNEKFEKAYQLLKPYSAAHPDDTEAYFLLGIAAMRSKRIEEAVEQFQQILAKKSDLPRVRLELARAYRLGGQVDKSRHEFQKVLDSNPPTYVRENIERFLAELGNGSGHSSPVDGGKNWQLYLAAGYLYDGNASAGPEARTADFFGLPFILPSEARAQSDSAVTTTLSFDHYLPIDKQKFGLRSNLTFNSLTYFDLTEFNYEVFEGSIGPRFRRQRWSLYVPIVSSYSRLGSERFRFALGTAPELRYAVTNHWLAIGRGLVRHNHYYHNEARNGTSWAANVAARRLIGDRGFFELGYRHVRQSTDAEFFSNDRDGIYAALFTELPMGFDLYVRPGISWNDYDAREAAFDEVRKDKFYSLTVKLSHKIGNTGLVGTLGYAYMRDDSNLTIYKFKRNQIALRLSMTF